MPLVYGPKTDNLYTDVSLFIYIKKSLHRF